MSRTSGILFPPLSALFLAVLFLMPAIAWGGEIDKRLEGPRGEMADLCQKQVKHWAKYRCFYTLKEYLNMGLWFVHEDAKLLKYDDYYFFVPKLNEWMSEITRTSLPEARALRKNKHDRKKDAEALKKYFRDDLDDLLCTYIDKLASLKGLEEESFSEIVGKDVLTLHEYADDNEWLGHFTRDWVVLVQFQGKMEVFLKTLGFRQKKFSDSKYAVATWYSPRELRALETRETVGKEWNAFKTRRAGKIGEKLARIKKDIDVEEVEGQSETEKALDVKLRKWRSKHFAMEARLTDGNVVETLAVLEAAFAEILKTVGSEDPGRIDEPMRCIVLGSKDLYAKYWVAMKSETPDEARRKAETTRSLYDPSANRLVFKYGEYDAYLRDSLVEGVMTASLASLGYVNIPRWLKIGLAMQVSLEVLGTADSAYVRPPEGTDTLTAVRWMNYYGWKQLMKELEAGGKAPSTVDVLSRDKESITTVDSIKMYCFIRFLLIEEPDRLPKILKAASEMGWKAGEDGEFPALKAAGWTLAGFDEAYKKFISR